MSLHNIRANIFLLHSIQNVEVVDTTCPWVSKVWNTVDMHQKKGLTSIIHGKYSHEETVATTSFCEDYICVKNMKEAEMVADYILNGGDKEAFMKHFAGAHSAGFDPDIHLQKLGLANQTTMYKKETRAIGQLLQKTMMKKYGPVDAQSHYVEFDTICDATQVCTQLLCEYEDKHGQLLCYAHQHHQLIPFSTCRSGTTRRNSRIGRKRVNLGIGLYPCDWRMGFLKHGPFARDPRPRGNSCLSH